MNKNYYIVGLILLTFFVISFMTNILGALNPNVSQSYELTETMAGFLPFAFFIAYACHFLNKTQALTSPKPKLAFA